MKSTNIFVDVEMTLVDANGKLLPGALEGLSQLKKKGCHLFLWSTHGAAHALKVAKLHKVKAMFEGFAAKPDIIIDDMPETVLHPFVFDVHGEGSWPEMAEKIISKHVD